MSSITYDDLRTSLKRCDAGYAAITYNNLGRSELVMRSRIREVFHLAVIMCDSRMGTIEEIKKLVNDRIRYIQNETSAFLPNIFEKNEEEKVSDNSFLKSAARNTTSMDRMPDSSMDDADNWETDSEASTTHQESHNDEEPKEQINKNGSTLPHPNEPLTFRSVQLELQDALANYEQDYVDEAGTVDYYEAQQAFHDGIRQAKKPGKGLTPEKLWNDVEKQVIQSAYMARRRQYVESEEDQRVARVWAQLRNNNVRSSSTMTQTPVEDSTSDASTDEEDDDVRRMIAEVAEGDEESDEDVVVPETPTRSPTSARVLPPHKRRLNSIYDSSNEYALLSVGKRSAEAPPSSPKKKSTQPNPSQQYSYHFAPVMHAGQPMSAAPTIMQNFYRATVQHTLEEMLNNTSSEEARDWINAYWMHIEKEVPAPEKQSEPETSQAIQRPGWLRSAFRNSGRRDVNRNGWR